MAAIGLAVPILPDKSEAWRRFYQELLGSRRDLYEASRRRLGIAVELTWVMSVPPREVAVLYIEAEDPAAVLAGMALSDFPFDLWFREQWLVLSGIDLAGSRLGESVDLVFEWRAS